MFCLSLVLSLSVFTFTDGNTRVAVIGGGIGGSTTAYHLRKLLPNDAEIVVFEKGKIGGRLTTLDVHGSLFEAGGSIIHPRNEYMKNFTAMLGLEATADKEGSLGIFTGQQFHFLSTSSPLFDMAMAFARYGLDLFRMDHFVSTLLERFSNIYDLQRKGVSFRTVPELLQKISGDQLFTDMTQANALKFLADEIGLSERVLDQLVGGAMRMNYNQDLDGLNAFVAGVSLAGTVGGLWAVRSGNFRVCEGLLKRAEAKVIMQAVVGIERVGDTPAYRLTTADGQESTFDAVVLAAPLEMANISFNGFPTTPPSLPATAYQITHVTFVKGRPSRAAVLLNPYTSNGMFPDTVLTSKNESTPFSSIGRQVPVGGRPVRGAPVWKVFSQKALTREVLDKLFLEVEGVVQTKFMAYPKYSPPEQFVPFVLDNRLFYTSSIERAASAMEMSALSGVNAALLVREAVTQ